MCAEGGFVQTERPNAKVVHLADTANVEERLLHLLHVDALGDALHQYVEHIANDGKGGEEDNDREDEGADRVDDVVLGKEVDDQRGDQHTQTLEEVAQNVHKGGPHVDVALSLVLGAAVRSGAALCDVV